ncbi:MAG: restriction endonuclease subunit R [Bacteroidetes bacterium]|nr:MAG: restriction endonuclease subunit R [Bacteroidota bacterium]
MRKLNLPEYEFRYRDLEGRREVLDVYRKKYVLLTPEEEVRQRFARYLVEDRSYPASLIMSECSLSLNGMQKRCDLLVHKPAGRPMVLVECKAPDVAIGQGVFEQAARYNLNLKLPYLMLTNGLKHYCFFVDHKAGKVEPMGSIPDFEAL